MPAPLTRFYFTTLQIIVKSTSSRARVSQIIIIHFPFFWLECVIHSTFYFSSMVGKSTIFSASWFINVQSICHKLIEGFFLGWPTYLIVALLMRFRTQILIDSDTKITHYYEFQFWYRTLLLSNLFHYKRERTMHFTSICHFSSFLYIYGSSL